ncbi:MAG TPA: SAF domain-containing protein [Methanosarcinales archaeon]|nr:SAF domain-containing protein [Methanosarcinales archaeon]
MGLNEKIKELARQGKSINVAVAGLGQMGKSLVSHLNDLAGFKILAVADKDPKKVADMIEILGITESEIFKVWTGIYECQAGILGNGKAWDMIRDSKIDEIINISNKIDANIKIEIEKAFEEGRILFTDDVRILPGIENIDIVVDATGYTEVGAFVALSSIAGKKHVVTLNVETDITVGPILKKMSKDYGVVYTLSAGDEPAALKELYDFADGLGLEVICAGKGKNNPLNMEANPATLADYAASKGSSAKMMTSFVDGTKSMVEMACLSNATGLIPDCRGMHGARVSIKELAKTFSLKKDGGILDRTGVVDFAIGDLAPGVFLVYSTKNKMIKDVLNYLALGQGPNYLLYRPYHLTSIETPLSIARVYFDREPWIVPSGGLVSDVLTVAKKDLAPGEIIDGIGGYMVYGLIDLYETTSKEKLLPIGLSQGCILKKCVKKGEPISYDDVDFPSDTLLLQLRKLQDKIIQDKQ